MEADEIIRLLDELGTRLTPAGEYVFELAVRQVFIEGVFSIIYFTVVGIVGFLILRILRRWADNGNVYNDRDMGLIIGYFVYGFAMLILTINAFTAVPYMLNPEYAALKKILENVTGSN